MYFASIRLAVALVCVGASLILGAHWFGFVPDATPIMLRARQDLSEAIAVNAAAHVRKQQWIDLATTLQTHVDRNPELLSIGLRNDFGGLRVDTGHHDEIWPTTEEGKSQVDAIEVPISLNRRPWGRVELCFRQPHVTPLARTMHHPLVRLLSFFVICGVVAYTVFVVRILRLFNNTQVVPDRVRQALDTLAEGLLVLDEHGGIVLANRAFAELVGMPPDELANRLASDLNWVAEDLTDQDYPWSLAIDQSLLQTERILRYTLDSGAKRIFSVNAAPLGKERAQRGALATFRDVTHVEEHRAELERMLGLLRRSRDEIEQKNRELEILATQDSLTGCLNRRAFFERFEKLWSQRQVDGTLIACIMIDVDHFKSVNDTYGHHIGDEVLRAVSATIRRLAKDHGLACRYGGEEFCILVPGFDVEQALSLAEATRLAISAIRFDEPTELRLTASLGISEIRFGAKDPQDLINQADTCLYVAKREGRDRSIVFNPSFDILDEAEKTKKSVNREHIEIPYQAVTALVTALSYRDTNTVEHSRRVANLCSRASEGLFDPAEKYVLEIAGLLHDIGKIGVPDHILLKPGALTREEWEVMGRHDRIGVEIIAGSFDCPQLSEIMSNHHAFYGGHARDPHLPVGEDIPIGARMLSIADSYDAMVSDRVYRKGRTHAEAVNELRRCAGTQFDPRLVDHFIERIEGVTPSIATGAIEIRKQKAIEIGYQVQRLADAVGAGDIRALRSLASSVAAMAENIDLEAISLAASKIEVAASEDDCQSLSLLRDTHELLDLCRATQSEFLKSSLVCEAEQLASGNA